ncbi:DUF6596 domain-containing protein [Actinomadura syzygii]|uniref:DUF6596 domain-containing protein n=1 Tax=Actinomadura syzygii TaxID=1427538 RepID=UPI003619C60A
MCCHPVLSPEQQVALTLRSVGGLRTGEIARAFLVPEATMGQRISRAKRRIRDSGVPFRMPAPGDRDARLAAVPHVLYLVFGEGYTATAGTRLFRGELAAEAIRLARTLHRLLAVRAHLLEMSGDAAGRGRCTGRRPGARTASPSSATSTAARPACDTRGPDAGMVRGAAKRPGGSVGA